MIFSGSDFEFLSIEVSGTSFPPNPKEVISPEAEDPFWEISYPDGTTIITTGNVSVIMKSKKLEALEGGKVKRIREEGEAKSE